MGSREPHPKAFTHIQNQDERRRKHGAHRDEDKATQRQTEMERVSYMLQRNWSQGTQRASSGAGTGAPQ